MAEESLLSQLGLEKTNFRISNIVLNIILFPYILFHLEKIRFLSQLSVKIISGLDTLMTAAPPTQEAGFSARTEVIQMRLLEQQMRLVFCIMLV